MYKIDVNLLFQKTLSGGTGGIILIVGLWITKPKKCPQSYNYSSKVHTYFAHVLAVAKLNVLLFWLMQFPLHYSTQLYSIPLILLKTNLTFNYKLQGLSSMHHSFHFLANHMCIQSSSMKLLNHLHILD